jgi:hypothetical protein
VQTFLEVLSQMASQGKLCPLMSTFALNCLLLNDDPKRQVFTVKVPEADNVSILKELIKEKKARQLAHLDASDLILWKVRLSPDQYPSQV